MGLGIEGGPAVGLGPGGLAMTTTVVLAKAGPSGGATRPRLNTAATSKTRFLILPV